jgi:hypothetical protein
MKRTISTAEAAARLGIKQNRVTQICRGHRSPRKFGKKQARDWFLSEHEFEAIQKLFGNRENQD